MSVSKTTGVGRPWYPPFPADLLYSDCERRRIAYGCRAAGEDEQGPNHLLVFGVHANLEIGFGDGERAV
jgi:hypothetical protein